MFFSFFVLLIFNRLVKMLARDLVSDVIPSLKTSDTAQTALNWMEIFRVSHLPIVNNLDFLGLISDGDIFDLNQPDEAIGNHNLSLKRIFVRESTHLFEIINLVGRNRLTLIPVLDESDHYKGVISYNDILSSVASLSSFAQPGGIIIIKLVDRDYSAGHIAQIIESNDAKILAMYISSRPDSVGIQVTVKVNVTDLTSIIKTFERYSYDVETWISDNDNLDMFYADRYNMLMKYLNM
jgi:acetoin utilization protein AcuB